MKLEIKEQLLEAMRQNIRLGVDNKGRQIVDGQDELAQELERLMCYREVRAYYSCFNNYCEEDEWSSIEEDIIGLLVDNYPEQTIQDSIKKVKNELK